MGLQIEDGKGGGSQAEVRENKLLVSGVLATQEHYANHNDGLAYNLLFTATPTIGACFFYIKNTNPVATISVEGIWLKMVANDYIEVKLNDFGIPIGGADITPVNLNTGTGNRAVGVFKSGASISGLSGASTVLRHHHGTSGESEYLNFNQDIILGPNGVLSLYVGAGTVEIDGALVFNYTSNTRSS